MAWSRRQFLGRAAAGTVLGVVGPGAVGLSASAHAAKTGVTIASTSTNSTQNPLGIDDLRPRLGWKLESPQRAQVQAAYRVLVASSPDQLSPARVDVWDSGRVESAESTAVAYDGPELSSRTRYHWATQVWDGAGRPSGWSEPGWFETGLLEESDWEARWIEHDFEVPLPTQNTDQNTPVELSANATLGQSFTTDRAFDSAGGRFPTWSTADSGFTLTLRVNGPGGDVLGTRHVTNAEDNAWADVELDTPADAGTYYLEMSELDGQAGWWSHTDDVYDGGTAFADGSAVEGDRTIRWNPTEQGTDESSAQMRQEFTLDRPIASARIYSTALGNYEMFVNGQAVSSDRLAPGWTDYDQRVQYQTYDVTEMLRRGDNAIGARLAPGWYTGKIAIYGPYLYGHKPALLAQLEFTYDDGTVHRVVSDTSWTSGTGPIVSADHQDGEVDDERREPSGWAEPGFDESEWNPVVQKADVDLALVAQADPPARVTQELEPVELTEPEPGVHIVDLGQNIAGVARLIVRGAEAGDEIRLRHGEELNPDGTLYTANLRTAKATNYYTAKGADREVYEPTFTFHGFRYVEVTGYPSELRAADVVGLAINTDAPETSSLETSSALLNQLHSNIVWSQRGNFLSVPTDCPQRDERMGWTGDINVYVSTAAHIMDIATFIGDKWLRDLRDAQQDDGAVTDVVPYVPIVGAGNTGWGDAAVTVPYELWQAYGDTRVIDENWDAMSRWLDYLEENSEDYIRPDEGYGDWLNLDDNAPRDLVGTAYFARVAGLMADMAEATGRPAEARQYEELAAAVTEAFQDEYLAADGSLTGDSQTGYVLALSYGLVPDDLVSATADHLVAALEERDLHLATGFLGTPDLLPVLSQVGHTDLAYRLINHRTYPSWGYSIRAGATTIWERWNSKNPDGSFGPVEMNSFNHYAYGAVGTWMYRNIAGIRPDPGSPGYANTIIAPQPGGGLRTASGTHESRYGEIATSWRKLANGDLRLQVSVPVNSTATVQVPATSAGDVREGRVPAEDADGVELVDDDDGVVTYRVGSGDYRFTVDAPRRER